jgi:hypothetical protein
LFEEPVTETPTMTAAALVISLVIYFVPTLVGWFCARVLGAALPLRRLFVLNLVVGWTGIGWFVCFGYLVIKMTRGAGGRSGRSVAAGNYSAPTASQLPSWEPSQERRRCGACGGDGRTRCSMCAGQGGRWTQPMTATDTSRWEPCGSCVSSGSVTCSSCSGSGYGV